MECVSRQKAVDVLEDRIKRLERRLNAMLVLKEVVPWEALDETQEELLWDLIVGGFDR